MLQHVRTHRFAIWRKAKINQKQLVRSVTQVSSTSASLAVLSPPGTFVYIEAVGRPGRRDARGLGHRCHERSTHPAMGTGSSRAEPSPADIQAQLDRILESPAFRVSPRRRALLQFLVEETLAGRADRLKGIRWRSPSSGATRPSIASPDPVVRFEARRLRRDLDSYYVDAGGPGPGAHHHPEGRLRPALRVAPGADGRAALRRHRTRSRSWDGCRGNGRSGSRRRNGRRQCRPARPPGRSDVGRADRRRAPRGGRRGVALVPRPVAAGRGGARSRRHRPALRGAQRRRGRPASSPPA